MKNSCLALQQPINNNHKYEKNEKTMKNELTNGERKRVVRLSSNSSKTITKREQNEKNGKKNKRKRVVRLSSNSSKTITKRKQNEKNGKKKKRKRVVRLSSNSSMAPWDTGGPIATHTCIAQLQWDTDTDTNTHIDTNTHRHTKYKHTHTHIPTCQWSIHKHKIQTNTN